MKIKLILFACALFGIVACNNQEEAKEKNIAEDDLIELENRMDNDVLEALVQSIPNPLELSVELKNAGILFSEELLNRPENISKYKINYSKALNLGVYGCDLMHLNVYDKTVSALLYLQNIKRIAGDLQIDQFFDLETLSKLSENSQNSDTVMLITSTGFERMNNFLIEQDRGEISVLISFGTWLENIYLVVANPQIKGNEAIYTRVGEQKIIIENILMLLSSFDNDPYFKDLSDNVKKLKTEFEKVTIIYSDEKPIVKEEEGARVLIDNSSSRVEVEDEVITNIYYIVRDIRNKIISG